MTDQLPQWMNEMAPRLTEVDPGFLRALGSLMGAANRREDALDGRVRILITMALDLAAGSSEGTRNMSQTARGFGVTDAQIADVVKVCGAAAALQRIDVGGAAFIGADGGAVRGVEVIQSQLSRSDPDFLAASEGAIAAAFAVPEEDGLAVKDKHLVRLALDAAFGSPGRVRYDAERCRSAGASDDEILSALKMAFVNAFLIRLATGRSAFAG